jgi:RNA polymerase sigma factor (sigma-70 family)
MVAMAHDELAVLLERERRALSALLRARGATPDEVDDVLQSAFIKASLALTNAVKAPASLHGWFVTIVKNTYTDLYRTKKREVSLEDAPVGAEADGALDASSGCRCAPALAAQTLSKSTAALVSHVDVEGLSVKDAANLLGLAPNAASVRLHRAHASLRSAMLAHCGPCCGSYRSAAQCECHA